MYYYFDSNSSTSPNNLGSYFLDEYLTNPASVLPTEYDILVILNGVIIYQQATDSRWDTPIEVRSGGLLLISTGGGSCIIGNVSCLSGGSVKISTDGSVKVGAGCNFYIFPGGNLEDISGDAYNTYLDIRTAGGVLIGGVWIQRPSVLSPDNVREGVDCGDGTNGNMLVPIAANLKKDEHAGWHHVGPPAAYEVTGTMEQGSGGTPTPAPQTGLLRILKLVRRR